MPHWQWADDSEIPYITIPHWREAGVKIAFSSRWGGSSSPPFASLNLGLHVGDEREKVLDNRSRFLASLGQKLENLVCCQQVHGQRVLRVDKSLAGSGAWDYESALPGFDAMVGHSPGIILGSFYADCIPLFFFDPKKRVVAMAHSGWKGTMGKIAAESVKEMLKLGCLPRDIEVFLGPGIGPCCFQIQPELVLRVKTAFHHHQAILRENAHGYYWDLRESIKQSLQESGIQEAHIIDSHLCTACNCHLFFSYRAEKGRTGRMGAFIGLED
ncbi:peptidoglycan editing factor PgeF [Syntrophomonas wolfei]|jgi:hypothetical protein|uniref:Purine nucleoside phosphorylase n=1 Tax=Syntrophomonas wolfei TaxID=863 RepID=A0A354YWS8_9FIRM|nr:peptidoglycan editing factor PgeF [Syntrophomonas wolfei]HBK53800.1 peptidoglycan editing factor PgeF [Syntrophomonas wolfei]